MSKNTESKAVVAYKAFNPDMTCRDFQYEVGKTYEIDGEIEICKHGFHACTVPFDCWSYYDDSNTFARVTLSGQTAAHGEDSKVVGARITIDARIDLPSWIDAHVTAIVYLCNTAKGAMTSSRDSHVASTGDGSHVASTGDGSHVASTGYRSHAVSTGDGSHAASTGDGSHVASTGDGSHAASTGYHSHAVSTGYRSHVVSTGYRSHVASTGDDSHVASTGDDAHAVSAGYRSHAASTGDGSHVASTGDGSHAVSTGYRSHAVSAGYRSHAEVKGDSAIAASFGAGGTAKAESGGWIVLARYDYDDNLVEVRTAAVGTEGIEAGKTYRLSKAGFEEVS